MSEEPHFLDGPPRKTREQTLVTCPKRDNSEYSVKSISSRIVPRQEPSARDFGNRLPAPHLVLSLVVLRHPDIISDSR